MGILYKELELVKYVVDQFAQSTFKRAAFISYPDILITREKLKQIFGKVVDDCPAHPKSKEIIEWHKAQKQLNEIICINSLMSRMGFTSTFVDLVNARGFERILDLGSKELRELGEFELIVDIALQHCSNIGIAFRSVARACVLGGYILHFNPLTAVNQGFFNVCPEFYKEFYENNGFKIIKHLIVTGKFEEILYSGEILYDKRMRDVPDNSFNIILVKRLGYKPIEFPIQNKFQKWPNSLL